VSRYVFVDLETTSLDPRSGDVWEMAYAIDLQAVVYQCFVGHALYAADPEALKINRYHERWPGLPDKEAWPWEMNFKKALNGATLVAANPAFDADFLRFRWNLWREVPWRYRMLDLETYAMPALHLDEPKGLAYITEQLGTGNPDPHTAKGDVVALRDAFYELQRIYDERLP
jgi:DNA polymerase III epsilon subunit-like protein